MQSRREFFPPHSLPRIMPLPRHAPLPRLVAVARLAPLFLFTLFLLLPLSACSDDGPALPSDSSTEHPDTTGQSDTAFQYLDPVPLCTIADGRLTEISGIAPSRLRDGLYWLHNDSGGEARLFAVDSTGRTRATVTLIGAANRDWEDIASVWRDGQAWLYVGDIGDNGARREFVTVYRLLEPAVAAEVGEEALQLPAEAARFRYPDEARDCEALIVDPRDGAVVLVEKSGNSAGVYRAAWPGDGGETVLERIASVRPPFEFSLLRMITAADLHPGGGRLLLRTYGAVLEYRISNPDSLSSAFPGIPRVLPTPGLTQAEAVCYRRDGRDILTTTEGARPPLVVIRRHP